MFKRALDQRVRAGPLRVGQRLDIGQIFNDANIVLIKPHMGRPGIAPFVIRAFRPWPESALGLSTVMPTSWNSATKLMHIGIKGYDLKAAE